MVPAAPAQPFEGVDGSESANEEFLPRLSFSLTRTETAMSFDANNSAGTVDSISSSTFAPNAMTPAQIHDTFLSAEHFVSVVLSRMHKDPMAIDPKMWALQNHANRLWALRQQALLGSCETSRGSKEYLQALDASAGSRSGGTGTTFIHWRPCCFRMLGESKIKLWQNLGDMPHEQAKVWYIHIVTDICPEWRNPLRTDSALLRAWTPDDESDQCTICAEAFTFLNRRHHCRRCLILVCAVCSPHSAPLRVFTQQTTPKRLRICNTCFYEMGGNSSSNKGAPNAKQNQLRRSVTSVSSEYRSTNTEEDSLLGDSAAHPYSDQDMLELETSQSNSSISITNNNKPAPQQPPAYLTTATIHCGVLDFFHGSGFRKSWHEYFFVLLIRKGSLGMFLQAQDHLEKKKRPAAVYKLSGYAIRVKSQKRRPHQFRVSHPTKKILHFAAKSIEEMNAWISQLIKAIDIANELEALSPIRMARSPRGSMTSVTSTTSGGNGGNGEGDGMPENDFTEEEDENGSAAGVGAGGGSEGGGQR